LVIGHFGPADYALIAVVVGLQFLLIFSDFGTSANILEESGRYRAVGDVGVLGRAVGQAWRTIIVGNAAVLLVAIGLMWSGTWGGILGFPHQESTAGLAVVMTLGVNVAARPLSLANPLVAGLGRPAVATLSQALGGVVSLGSAALCITVDLPLPFIAATPLIGQLVATLPLVALSARAAPGLIPASARAMFTASGAGTKMRHLAVPMLVIQIVGPLNDQLDRLILSHLSTVEAVATYALAAQLFNTASSLVSSLLPALWAEYAGIRAASGLQAVAARAFLYVRKLALLMVLFGASFSVLSWLLAGTISAGRIHLPWLLCAVLGATLPLNALQTILGVAMTDPAGLRMQAILMVFTTATNLALSVALAARLGAVGPALATLVVACVQVLVVGGLARRRLRGTSPADPPLVESRP
jgi:O-antigen/teichoic acid export membrane protein